MRILQVAPPWFAVPPPRYGGIELVISTLTEGLVAAGHEVTLLASGGSRTAAELATVYDVPPSTDLGDAVTELLHVTAVDDIGPVDIVHDHTLLGATRLAARGAWPLVHTLHGPWSDRSRALYRHLADHLALVAISHDQAARANGVPISAVIPHGLDLDRYPVSLDHSDDLAFVGRASPEKGPAEAIEVARRTGRRLVMAIKVNEAIERAYFDEVLAPLLPHADVELVRDATHEQKTAIMARAHAVVAPVAWDEPFGLVLAEAGACGTPVVAFGRGAAPEVVRDGVNGIVVDPAAGVDGLVAAVEAAGTIDRASCRHHVAEQFAAARMVDDHLQLYADLRAPRFKRARPAELAPPFVLPHLDPETSHHGHLPSRA